jgi:hypothetical protein
MKTRVPSRSFGAERCKAVVQLLADERYKLS